MHAHIKFEGNFTYGSQDISRTFFIKVGHSDPSFVVGDMIDGMQILQGRLPRKPSYQSSSENLARYGF